MGREAAGWVVTCPAYQLGPYGTRVAAEKAREQVERLGACAESHDVAEVGRGDAQPA